MGKSSDLQKYIEHKTEYALTHFGNGFNCAQSVLCAFSNEIGLTEDQLSRITSGFGAGMGKLQETCGAVTGAFMVLSYLGCTDTNMPAKQKDDINNEIRNFAKQFFKSHNSIKCRDLTGYDLLNEEEYNKAKEEGVFDKKCTGYIGTAIELICEKVENK